MMENKKMGIQNHIDSCRSCLKEYEKYMEELVKDDNMDSNETAANKIHFMFVQIIETLDNIQDEINKIKKHK